MSPLIRSPIDPLLSRSGTHANAPAGGGGTGRFRDPAPSGTGGTGAPHRHPPLDDLPGYDVGIDGSPRLRNIAMAFLRARKYVAQAVLDETSLGLEEVLDGILPALAAVLGVLAAFVAGCAALGALFSGVGAFAGAELGFEAGLFFLKWMGLGFLVAYVVPKLGEAAEHIGSGASERGMRKTVASSREAQFDVEVRGSCPASLEPLSLRWLASTANLPPNSLMLVETRQPCRQV